MTIVETAAELVGQPASPDTSKSCHRGPDLRETKPPIALAMSGLVSLAPNHADGDLMYRYLPAGPLGVNAMDYIKDRLSGQMQMRSLAESVNLAYQ